MSLSETTLAVKTVEAVDHVRTALEGRLCKDVSMSCVACTGFCRWSGSASPTAPTDRTDRV